MPSPVEQGHLTGNDFVCKDLATKQTVAYFRSVMTPQTKEGKLEISSKASRKDRKHFAMIPSSIQEQCRPTHVPWPLPFI